MAYLAAIVGLAATAAMQEVQVLAPIHPGSALRLRSYCAQHVTTQRSACRGIHSHQTPLYAQGAELRVLLLHSDRHAPHASGVGE